jgi:restriction endonuclease Mrr
MTVLDELSGFEFEDVMEDVFRNLGYEDVRQAEKVGDEGRDIIMEETVDGERRSVVVECKHTGTVGRPVVQKLHSAVATHGYDGGKRGMVVTTGRFTGPAKEYARDLRENDDPYPIELIDGTDLRAIAEEVGLDLYNGRIEILCEETLRPYDPARSVDAPIVDAVRDLENLDPGEIPEPRMHAVFRPVVRVRAAVDAVFETTVGVIHRVDEHDTFLVHADRDGPEIPEGDVQQLVTSNFHQRIDLDEDEFENTFDEMTVRRFGQTETEYKEWAVDRLQGRHTTTVSYTGDNNVTYTKTCEPNQSDISVQSITPVYLPRLRGVFEMGSYAYPYEYYAAGPSRETIEDGIHRCVQCERTDDDTYTYCDNCGSINCSDHTKTERLEGDPVCTGCAVTERFFFRRKYFYSEQNREQFRDEYEQMPIYEKAMENPPLLVGVVLTALLAVGFLLANAGVL